MVVSNDNITMTISSNSETTDAITARAYQTELMQQAKLENLVVCLPTGSGKTYIAVMLIKEMAHEIRESLEHGGKRTIFLVKTVQLVDQQSHHIRTHTDLIVGKYCGEMGVDFWEKARWDEEFANHQVLVFTSQIFLNIIKHNYFPLDKVNLLIFDECHHATGNNQYAEIMNEHYDKSIHPPRVLGLTASISNKKITPMQLADCAKDLERTYRARIATNSNRSESIQYGTSAQVERIPYLSYQDEIIKNNDSFEIPFDILRFMCNTIEDHITKRKSEYQTIERNLSDIILNTDYRGTHHAAYSGLSYEYTEFIQSPYHLLIYLRRSLQNLIDVGYEIGIYGLLHSAKELRKQLKSNMSLIITDNVVREVIRDTFERLECLIDDILKNLILLNKFNLDVFSSKVCKVLERIVKQYDVKNAYKRCIVFVERAYMARILSYVLTQLAGFMKERLNTPLKFNYVVGSGNRSVIGSGLMTSNFQREVIRNFRLGTVNVLIATAVVEEGLDVPQCDLVIRFNKPMNFSSYMQSKGRARAKHDTYYVLLMDQSDVARYGRDRNEFDDYESLEKMIQQGLLQDGMHANFTDDPLQIPPYCTSNGVVINAIRAAQLIFEYCLLLGHGQNCPPRFIFRGQAGSYTCILSMPASCPVRDDIICEGSSKKLAKYTCCLEMVKKLHKIGEFNEYCLPSRNRTLLKISEKIENQIFDLVDELFENKSESSYETLDRQIAFFPVTKDETTAYWHLYRITEGLGFIVPWEIMKLPRFNIYGHDETMVVDVVYLRTINFEKNQNHFENFCRYLFEYVFDDMNIENNILRFDVESSTFKLLPCLLTKSNDVDYARMKMICHRKYKPVSSISELNENELYYPWHLAEKHFYAYASDIGLVKQATDPLDFHVSSKNLQTYADYFEEKIPNITIQRNRPLATMKGIKKPIINHLTYTQSEAKDRASYNESQIVYYPIELLLYAPLNRYDLELIYKLPSILVRIAQLYRIEKLRKLFADNNICYSFLDAMESPPVTFRDALCNEKGPSFLPLVTLNYHTSISHLSNLQPLPDVLFQAVTRRSTDEKVDMENLEILGDCFLKLTVSMALYHRYPLASAGPLTIEKAKQISNKNLYRIVIRKKLKPYLNALKIVFRGKYANWTPPAYVIHAQNMNDAVDNDLGLQRYKHQRVKRKAFADMIEAFIGAYLVSSDYTTTMEFMQWLGLDVIPLDENNKIMDVPSIVHSYGTNDGVDIAVHKFYEEQRYVNIEKIINYEFKNKAYLISAFTHPSSFANRLTNCYERLEFLGDAVLDFLVTRHVFIASKEITPGLVTDIRQDLSNNGRLAYIFVAYRLHTYILHNSPDLFGKIQAYAGDDDLFSNSIQTDDQLNQNIHQWADSTAPKALADVFEALVGAIFLDADKCLATVWRVIEPLLRRYFDRSIDNPNLNPIRAFFEQGGILIEETNKVDVDDNGISISICIVEAKDGLRFEGRGENKKSAKYDACQKAVQFAISNKINNQ